MPEVLDISSDEEQSCSEGGLKSSDYDWIWEFLGMSDDEQKSEDSDDVVIIHENKPQSKSKSSAVAVKDVDDDDDGDCVVLDGDPENGVTSVDDEATGGSDELLVVGEKGQIACRDYPHARHLCAKFPFSSTPHERHCAQCHCYVCDSLAPCLMWGTGLSDSDHCHANDKIEIWKIQRKNLKVGNTSPLLASTKHGTSLLVGRRQCNGILPPDISHLPPDSLLRNQASRPTAMHAFSSFNSMPQNQASRPKRLIALSPSLNSGVQNQVPRPNNIPLYSTATNLTSPDVANHGRCQASGGSTLVRNRYQPHSAPKQWLGVRRHPIHRDRGSGASSLQHQLLRSHTLPNRVDNATIVNYPGHVSSGFSNHVNTAQQQCDKYHTATGFSSDRNCNEPNHVWFPRNLPLFPHQSSETQAYSQPLPQSNDGHIFCQSSIQGNDAPSSYVACLDSSQLGNQHQVGNQNENASVNIAQCGIATQETYQPKPQEDNQSETSRNADISAFNSSWTENSGQSTECLVECSYLQGSGSTNQPPNANESSNHVTATGAVEPPTESSHIPSSLVDIENWLFDPDLILRVSDNGALPAELSNIPSPDLGLVDTGMLLSEW